MQHRETIQADCSDSTNSDQFGHHSAWIDVDCQRTTCLSNGDCKHIADVCDADTAVLTAQNRALETYTMSVSDYCVHSSEQITVIRPHYSTTYDVHRRGLFLQNASVGQSVCHNSKPCKSGWTNRDAIWAEDLDRPKEPCVTWGSDPSMGRANFEGGKQRSFVNYSDSLPCAVQKWLNRSRCCLGPRKHLLGGWMHPGTTWWGPMNRPCAAALRPVVKSLWPLVIIIITDIFKATSVLWWHHSSLELINKTTQAPIPWGSRGLDPEKSGCRVRSPPKFH